MSLTPDERREILERKANIARSRLLRAVDALDARRHQIQKIGEQAKTLAVPSAIAALATVTLLGASVLSFAIARRRVKQRSLGWRVSQQLQKLDLVRQPSLLERVFEKTTMTVITMAAAELAKRWVKNTADGRLIGGRLAVGSALDAHHESFGATNGTP